METKLDIGYSELSGRILIGKSKESKTGKGVREWIGEKEDITSKFLFVVGQFFEIGTSRVITGGDNNSLFIHIQDTKEAKERLIKSLQKEINN